MRRTLAVSLAVACLVTGGCSTSETKGTDDPLAFVPAGAVDIVYRDVAGVEARLGADDDQTVGGLTLDSEAPWARTDLHSVTAGLDADEAGWDVTDVSWSLEYSMDPGPVGMFTADTTVYKLDGDVDWDQVVAYLEDKSERTVDVSGATSYEVPAAFSSTDVYTPVEDEGVIVVGDYAPVARALDGRGLDGYTFPAAQEFETAEYVRWQHPAQCSPESYAVTGSETITDGSDISSDARKILAGIKRAGLRRPGTAWVSIDGGDDPQLTASFEFDTAATAAADLRSRRDYLAGPSLIGDDSTYHLKSATTRGATEILAFDSQFDVVDAFNDVEGLAVDPAVCPGQLNGLLAEPR